MADFQRVVEFLRDLRLNPPPPVTDEIRQYAQAYADLCQQANERLRKCSGFLQQGLRSEAIHLADESPNLLDLVAALDLPEAGIWAEYCLSNGLPSPPPLQMDRAAQLNEAYAADQPLEHLLQQHRLLALSRAPVAQRLEVMRAIATADPSLGASAFWEKDLRVFERARIRELPPRFYAAVKNRDFGTISELAREIEQSPWLEPIPADLREAVADAYERMTRARIEDDLRSQLPALREAYAAKNFTEALALLKRWRDTIKGAGLKSIAAELASEVEPIQAWIQQEQELQAKQKSFVAATEQFALMLDANAPLSELEPAWEKLKKYEGAIPDDLQQRYQGRLHERVAAARRKFLVSLTGIGAGVVAILVIAGVIAFMYMRMSSADAWASQIQAANDSRDLAKALALIQDQEAKAPHLNENSKVATAKTATRALQQEFDRDTAVARALVSDLSAVRDRTAAMTTNESATPEQLVRAAGDVDDVLARMSGRDLSWVDTDKQLATAAREAENLRAALRDRAGAIVRTRVGALETQLAAVPENPSATQITQALTQVNALTGQAAQLRDIGGMDDTTKAAVNALLAKLEKRRESMDQTAGLLGDLAGIGRRATSAGELEKALQSFVAKFPEAGPTADFTKALEALPVAAGVEAWRSRVNGWGIAPGNESRFAPNSAKLAAERLEQLKTFLGSHAAAPVAPAAARYSEYLLGASEGMAERSTWHEAFTDITSNPLYSELSYMEDSNKQRYYTLGDIKRSERRINNQVTVVFEAIDPKEIAKRRTITIDPPVTLTTPKPVLLPHATVVNEIADKVKFISETNWDTFGFDVIEKLVANNDMDIVVKAILLQAAMNATREVNGWALGGMYDKAIQDLNRQKVTEIPWYDHTTPLPDATREALRKIIASIPTKQAALQRYSAQKAALFDQLNFHPTGTGVLLQNDKGDWVILARGASADGYKAWAVLAPRTAGQPGSLREIAVFSNGGYVIKPGSLADLPQGTMVFTGKP